jgi:hypothetical protein
MTVSYMFVTGARSVAELDENVAMMRRPIPEISTVTTSPGASGRSWCRKLGCNS